MDKKTLKRLVHKIYLDKHEPELIDKDCQELNAAIDKIPGYIQWGLSIPDDVKVASYEIHYSGGDTKKLTKEQIKELGYEVTENDEDDGDY